MSPPQPQGPLRRTLDVAALPEYAFGHNGLIWWGTIGFMVIEGSVFVMALVAYFFLRTRVAEWPPSLPNPDLTLGTVNTVILLASIIPNQLTKKAAEQLDVGKVRILLPICLVFGVAFVTVRAFEFGSLNCSWDDNAYASIVWFIMGVHTLHLVTDVVDSFVLTGLVFTAHVDPPRLVDVSENGLYWYFVVLSWIPIYLTVYFAPRLL
jgi:heme/copper-type cytochrome/quinol oxidase subunit 3